MMQYIDPLEVEQITWLKNILKAQFTPKALLGLLIIGPRLIDNFGYQRIYELEKIFKTSTPAGQKVLKTSLEFLATKFESIDDFAATYPVTIVPPRPAFPMLPIRGIKELASGLYRVFNSQLVMQKTGEPIDKYISRTGRIPMTARIKNIIRRRKPSRVHWCSYEKYDTPEETAEALQIKSEWSDCKLRVTIPTKYVNKSSFLAYNGDVYSKMNGMLEFDQYFTEPLAQDHLPLIGGGPQIAVTGAPRISQMEMWNTQNENWEIIYEKGSV